MRAATRPLLAGALVLAAGWVLGSQPLGLAGVGVMLAGGVALVVAALAQKVCVTRMLDDRVLGEGDPLAVSVRVGGALLLPATLRYREQAGPATSPVVRLRRRRPVSVTIPALPRGIYEVGPGLLAVRDLLGLVDSTVAGPRGRTVVVRPRVVELDGTFAAGPGSGIGQRPAAVRSGGSEPRGIREYREGESLRAVHWLSSARRGRLLVRELEEPPDEDTVVVLDLSESGHAGPVGGTSSDEAVRAAAALIRWEVAAGRSVGLVIGGQGATRLRVASLGSDWEAALDALAAAAPARLGPMPVESSRGSVLLVTTGPVGAVADTLLRRRLAAVVAVDAPTYAGALSSSPDPGLLRLASHGVAVAVVRAGDDLRAVLSAHAAVARA